MCERRRTRHALQFSTLRIGERKRRGGYAWHRHILPCYLDDRPLGALLDQCLLLGLAYGSHSPAFAGAHAGHALECALLAAGGTGAGDDAPPASRVLLDQDRLARGTPGVPDGPAVLGSDADHAGEVSPRLVDRKSTRLNSSHLGIS